MTRRWSALALAALVLLAGCGLRAPATDPSPDGGPATVELSIQNAAAETYAVDVSVLRGSLDGVRITHVNGTVRTVRAASVGRIPPGALESAARVEPLGEAAHARRYAVEPDAGVGDTIDGVPRNATVVYAVVRPSNRTAPFRTLGTTSCGPDGGVTSLSIAIRDDGLDVATTCGDGD